MRCKEHPLIMRFNEIKHTERTDKIVESIIVLYGRVFFYRYIYTPFLLDSNMKLRYSVLLKDQLHYIHISPF